MGRHGKVWKVLARYAALGLMGEAAACWRRRPWGESLAGELRNGFETLGPSFVKLGQLISVRPDVFPPWLVMEMEKLRDCVRPLPYDQIRQVVTDAFGKAPEDMFQSFDPIPTASASVAQVHKATLASGQRPVWGDPLPPGAAVAVKIVKPGVAELLRADLELARRLAGNLSRLGLLDKTMVNRVVDEMEQSAARELDMRREGRVADQFAFNFRHHSCIVIPRVAWNLTAREVLTMEYVPGWPLSRLDEARAGGVDAKAMAIRGAEAFMKQVLEDGLYHADLHHANLLLTAAGKIAYLDFGIHGVLTPAERRDAALILASLVFRDPDTALAASGRLGLQVPPGLVATVKRELLELMEATLAAGGSGGSDVKNFGFGLIRLFRRHGISIPAGYGLLVKALVTVEGVSRQLYPEIDIIELARPTVTRIIMASRLLDASLHPSRAAIRVH